MKSILAVVGIVALTACGSASSSETSALQGAAAGSVTSDAILLNASAQATNGGINPQAFAYEIKGDVLLGGNGCEAGDATAKLQVSKPLNGVVTVVAKVTATKSEPRICPRIFLPVYAHVSATVRGLRTDIRAVKIQNVNERGTLVDVRDLDRANEVVVTNVSAQPTNGGINPEAFAYDIKATVLAGSNACEAAASRIELQQTKIGHVVYVKAVRQARALGVMCTREYAPVYADLTITVRALSSNVSSVIVRNVDQLGADQAVESLVK
jgi:hypothetical protein